MEKSYLKLSVCYTQLMMKHKDLVEVSTGTVRSNTETEPLDEVKRKDSTQVSTDTARLNTESEVSKTLSLADDIFSNNEIKCLQCVPLGKNKDSTFILNCVEYAYKDSAASLTNKTLKGTRPRYEVREGEAVIVKPGKEPLTPEKVTRIRELFVDRVNKSKCLAGEYGERIKMTNFNQLIANAVKNLSNKQAPKTVAATDNSDLNL